MKRAIFLLAVLSVILSGARYAASEEDTLIITGQIALTNCERGFTLTLEEVKTLKGTTYVVQDPWMGENFYQGVELIELLRYVGYPVNAKKIVLVCSDGKEFEVAVKDAQLYPIMLAYASKGRNLPSSQGGPFKLVFPITAYPQLEKVYPADAWAWYVTEIRVEM